MRSEAPSTIVPRDEGASASSSSSGSSVTAPDHETKQKPTVVDLATARWTSQLNYQILLNAFTLQPTESSTAMFRRVLQMLSNWCPTKFPMTFPTTAHQPEVQPPLPCGMFTVLQHSGLSDRLFLHTPSSIDDSHESDTLAIKILSRLADWPGAIDVLNRSLSSKQLFPPLLLACDVQGRSGVAVTLLNRGINPTLMVVTESGVIKATSLHIAAYADRLDVLQWCFGRLAPDLLVPMLHRQVTHPSSERWFGTILHAAIRGRAWMSIHFLLSVPLVLDNVDLCAKDAKGTTLLDMLQTFDPSQLTTSHEIRNLLNSAFQLQVYRLWSRLRPDLPDVLVKLISDYCSLGNS
jgi:hypothetical protein